MEIMVRWGGLYPFIFYFLLVVYLTPPVFDVESPVSIISLGSGLSDHVVFHYWVVDQSLSIITCYQGLWLKYLLILPYIPSHHSHSAAATFSSSSSNVSSFPVVHTLHPIMSTPQAASWFQEPSSPLPTPSTTIPKICNHPLCSFPYFQSLHFITPHKIRGCNKWQTARFDNIGIRSPSIHTAIQSSKLSSYKKQQ
jgi:hypothetical protein